MAALKRIQPSLYCFLLALVLWFDRNAPASGIRAAAARTERPMTKTLVFGATGGTGRHVVATLLERNHAVKAIVRSKQRLEEVLSPVESSKRLNLLETIECSKLSDMPHDVLNSHVADCDAVVCCLGKNSDIFSEPRRLVTDATKQICCAMEKADKTKTKKFILMNSELVDVEGDAPRSFADRCVLGLLGRAVPPHQDNEEAANYLIKKERSQESFEWSIVRPTGLVDEEKNQAYKVLERREHGVFAGRTVARKAVGTFIADLVTSNGLWNKWKLRTPVVHRADELE